MDPQNQQPQQVFTPGQKPEPQTTPSEESLYALGSNPIYSPDNSKTVVQNPIPSTPEPAIIPSQNQQIQTSSQIPSTQLQNDTEPQQIKPLQYNSGQLDNSNSDYSQGASQDKQVGSVSWTASEFVAHEKNGGWFAILIAGSIILAAIIFIVTREWLSIIAITVLAVAVGVFGNLKPRVLQYEISPKGITVGDKHFAFEDFKSFSVIEDGAIASIQLLPQKRLKTLLTVYLDPAQTDNIIELLGDYLPFDQRKRDMSDKLSSRFRF